MTAVLSRLAGARVIILFAFHAFVFVASYAFAYLLRFDFSIPPQEMAMIRTTMPVMVGVQLVVGGLFGFYRGWWRYVGMADIIRLVVGLTTALMLAVAGWYLGEAFGLHARYIRAPRGVLLIDWAFALLTLFGARVAIRVGRDQLARNNAPAQTQKRVIIVGAGDAGETLAREIEHRPHLGMKVVGFVDDQRAKWQSQIRGIRVTGPIANIAKIADGLRADEALIAIPSASGKRLREIIQHLADADLRFKTMPGIDQLVSGKVHISQLRPVNVEDLLRRKRIELPGDPVRALFRGKRVLLTGAGGTIGSELALQILRFGPAKLALVERSEYALYDLRRRLDQKLNYSDTELSFSLLDIRHGDAVDGLVRTTRPEIIIHAAAHKHVPLGEENPGEYLVNNALATRKFAEICASNGVERFVFISTDKAINPTSVMGATKRVAEILLLDHARESRMTTSVVRFGNVIGSSGSVIPLFMEQIVAGGPVTVTHPDVTRYFIRTSEAISLVLQAATLAKGGQVFMLDMGEPIRIVELARDMIRLSNHAEDEIPIVFTGLRPGEKLFEEIQMKGEAVHPTIHPQIVVTEAPIPESIFVETWLRRAQHQNNAEDARRLLAEIVPESSLAEIPSSSPESSTPVALQARFSAS